MINVILWDWDNTLADTFQAVLAAQNDMRLHYGLPAWTASDAKDSMNHSGRNLIADMLGVDKVKQAQDFFWKAYASHSQKLQLKAGAKEMLELSKARGFYNILASNKYGPILRQEAKYLGVDDCFERIFGAEDTPCDKPSKAFTDTLIKGLDIKYLISIGDGKSDIQMARNYPDGISVLVGSDPHGSEFSKIKPDLVFKDLNALLDFSIKNEDISQIKWG